MGRKAAAVEWREACIVSGSAEGAVKIDILLCYDECGREPARR